MSFLGLINRQKNSDHSNIQVDKKHYHNRYYIYPLYNAVFIVFIPTVGLMKEVGFPTNGLNLIFPFAISLGLSVPIYSFFKKDIHGSFRLNIFQTAQMIKKNVGSSTSADGIKQTLMNVEQKTRHKLQSRRGQPGSWLPYFACPK